MATQTIHRFTIPCLYVGMNSTNRELAAHGRCQSLYSPTKWFLYVATGTLPSRLPPFWPNNPRIEAHFHLRRVATQIARFHYVVKCLPPRAANEIDDAPAQPFVENAYDLLKSVLLARTSDHTGAREPSLQLSIGCVGCELFLSKPPEKKRITYSHRRRRYVFGSPRGASRPHGQLLHTHCTCSLDTFVKPGDGDREDGSKNRASPPSDLREIDRHGVVLLAPD